MMEPMDTTDWRNLEQVAAGNVLLDSRSLLDKGRIAGFLKLYERGEQVLAQDREYAKAHRQRQETLRQIQEFYRLRLERTFDAVGGISHELLRWRDREGRSGEKPHSIRIRSASEWDALLQRAGWRPIEWVGGWDLEPFTHKSERLIVVSEKA